MSPSPRERPGRDPEAEADRLRARFRAVSRRIESRGGRSRPKAATPPGTARRAQPSLVTAIVVVLAIAVAVSLLF